MTSTYEMIKALPGKGTDWKRLNAALVENYLAVYAEAHNGAEPWAGTSTDVWNAAKGVRELREAAYQAATFAVHAAAQRSSFIPPSPETLSWGGFLGGTSCVWTDKDAEEAETAKIAAIIAAKGQGA